MTLNDTLDQTDLIDIYKTFHPKAAEYTFSSNAHRSYWKVDHMLDDKTCLNKIKKIEVISSIFSDHNGVELESNLNKNTQKHSNTWKQMACY